MDGTIHNDTIK